MHQTPTAEPAPAETLHAQLAEFTCREDVLCLFAIDQPLVTQMQRCIRFQAEIQSRVVLDLGYVLRRICQDPDLAFHMLGTESFARITAAYALLTNQPVDEVRHLFVPCSPM